MEVMQSVIDERQECKADTTLRVVGFGVEIEMGVPDRGPVHQRPEVPLVELVDPATSIADSPPCECSSVSSKGSYSSERVEGEREQTIQNGEHLLNVLSEGRFCRGVQAHSKRQVNRANRVRFRSKCFNSFLYEE